MPLGSLGKGPWQRDRDGGGGSGGGDKLPEQPSIFRTLQFAKTLSPMSSLAFLFPLYLQSQPGLLVRMDENPKQLRGGRELGQLCATS